METLPVEILLQIALNCPESWRGMLVMRSFADLSAIGKFKRIGLKKFNAPYGCPGGEYKKNYTVINMGLDDVTPLQPNRYPIVPKYIFRGFTEPGKWYKSLNLPLIAPTFPWGKKLAYFLSGCVKICRVMNELNSGFKYKKIYLLKPGRSKFVKAVEIKTDCDVVVHTTKYSYSWEYYPSNPPSIELDFGDFFIQYYIDE